MLKLLMKGKDGEKDTVTLGLEEGNIQMLKEDKPIGFPCTEIGLDDPRAIVIVYDGPDWKANAEAIESNPAIGFCFVLTDEHFDKLKSGNDAIIVTPDYNFVIAYGKDNQTLCDRFKSGIGPETRVVRTGFAPSDEPEFFSNN